MTDTKNHHETSRSVIMARLCGEVTTKSDGVRQKFNRRLVQNLRDALDRAGVEARVKEKWFRVDIRTDDRRALEVVSRVFGIQALSWADSYVWDSIDDVVEIGESLFKDLVPGKTFAVRTRRAGFRQQIPFTSVDVDRALGARLVAAGGKVNLDDHEVRVGVEVRKDRAFFFEEEVLGPAGLPGGVEGRAVAMISGGFDSAVATWMAMRRGVDMDFLFFNLAGPPQERAVKTLVHALCNRWAFGYAPKLHVVDLRPMVAEIRSKTSGHYWQLLLKRVMSRAADLLAQNKDYPALITGESCGQVSSQTLRNMAAIAAPVQTMILRPLVGLNKEEIIQWSKVIGTHDISAGVPEFCSLEGGPPSVDATREELDEEEGLLDLSLLPKLIRHRQIYNVLDLTADEEPAEVRVDEIPEGAVVIDLRDDDAFRRWSVDGAVHMPLERALQQAHLLPKEASYLLYCEVGLKSAFLAESMRREGFEAFSFSGGVPRLKKKV